MLEKLDFRERTKLRRILYAKPTIILLGVIALLVAHGAWGMYQKSIEALAKRDKAQEELHAMQEREKGLQGDILRFSTPRGQEGEIRDRYMVAKDGEKVIIIADPETPAVHTVTVSDPTAPTLMERVKHITGGQ